MLVLIATSILMLTPVAMFITNTTTKNFRLSSIMALMITAFPASKSYSRQISQTDEDHFGYSRDHQENEDNQSPFSTEDYAA
jgi:hypothetical protein